MLYQPIPFYRLQLTWKQAWSAGAEREDEADMIRSIMFIYPSPSYAISNTSELDPCCYGDSGEYLKTLQIK